MTGYLAVYHIDNDAVYKFVRNHKETTVSRHVQLQRRHGSRRQLEAVVSSELDLSRLHHFFAIERRNLRCGVVGQHRAFRNNGVRPDDANLNRRRAISPRVHQIQIDIIARPTANGVNV
jgi:hypothetical protein